MDNNININGLDKINSDRYQKEITQKSEEILAGKDSISVNDLKSKPLFQDAFNNLNEEQKQTVFDNISKIANLDNDQEINKEELNTVLTLMDANFDSKNESFVFDGKFEISENSALLKGDMETIKPQQMSRKEALNWVDQHRKETGCSKKEAYAAFKEEFGYEVPKNFWGKIGNGFKNAGAFLITLGLAIVFGNSKIQGK